MAHELPKTLGLVFIVGVTACGGQGQPANDPSASEESTTAAQPAQTPPGSGLQADIQFEDRADTDAKADRTPPPTPAYKPEAKPKTSVKAP